MTERTVYLYVSTNKTGRYMIAPYLTWDSPGPGYNVMKVDSPDGRRAKKQLAVKLMRQAIADGAEEIDVEYEFDWKDGIERLPPAGATVHICAMDGPRIGVYTGRLALQTYWPMFSVAGQRETIECRFWSDELTGKHSAQVTEA